MLLRLSLTETGVTTLQWR